MTARRLRRSDRISLQPVEPGVWGIYNLDQGNFLFVDELGHTLLELAGRLETREALLEACLAAFDTDPERIRGEVVRRLDELEEVGALRPAPEQPLAEVLLIDPPCPEKMVGVRGPAKGLCYLAAALAQQGVALPKILDMRSVSPQVGEERTAQLAYFAKYAGRCHPRVIGITAVSATIEEALFVARLCRATFPEAFIVLGGPHASYEWAPLLRRESVLDAVVLGEGEISFPRLVSHVLESGGRPTGFAHIQGIAWRGADGAPVSSGWSPGVEALDTLSIPDDRAYLLNASDYVISYARLISARGCTFKCSFCSTATFTGRRLRERSVENILEEVRYYWKKYGIQRFSFDDDIFTIHKKRALELCRALEQAEFAGQLEWGCNTRLDCIDETMIDALARAGCRFILFGVESGSPEVQDRFGKGRRSLLRFREKIDYMASRGIEAQLNFILGLPGEDSQSVELVIDLIRGLWNIECAFNFLNVFPGTPLARDMQALQLSYLSDKDADRYSVTAPTVTTATMNPDDQVAAYLKLQWFREQERKKAQMNPREAVLRSPRQTAPPAAEAVAQVGS
jgi:radical SAM superfamily enzyme YgiQ (UPF0313 family)